MAKPLRGRRRAVAAGLLAGVALAISAVPALATTRHVAPRVSAQPSVGGLHVLYPTTGPPYLADPRGRFVLLRGVDSNALVQYASDFQEQVPLHRSDLAEMAALGFNFLRLAVSWSRIAPAPGHIDAAYLAQVVQVLRWAARSRIYVLVDMHQDRYNRHLWPGQEVDGAPDWATLTDGTPCTSIQLSTTCAQVAEQNFWDNAPVAGRGLQSWYLQALVALGRSVERQPNLAGIELMNEPTQGALPPGAFERGELYPFYRRMIAGMRAAGIKSPLWFEPSVLRDTDDNALSGAGRFSSDPQLVYAVHIYTDVFSPPFSPSDPKAHLRASYQAAAAEARSFGVPWVDDEFGANATPAWDAWLRNQQQLQNQFLVGSGFWVWKQQPGFYGWGTVEPDGALRRQSERAQLLSLPHVDATPGRLLATTVSPNGLTAKVTGPGGTMALWSGTEVTGGGSSLLARPLTRVLIDGRAVRAQCAPVSFHTAAVGLTGCRLRFALPAGTHLVKLLAQ
ncbi:MAG: glycoside hydrolase family 5 protein [Mycobacteriales bacterium]